MKTTYTFIVTLLLLFTTMNGFSQEVASTNALNTFTINNTWMLISTFLVFIMHLGFATLEVGLTRAKNTVNILFKNILVVAIGLLTYTLIGFSLMYPDELWNGIIGFAGFGLHLPENGLTPNYNTGYTYWTDFMFQGMFAATAATIVSGAVAERIRLDSFLIFSAIYVALIYPIVGSWGWGGGWLTPSLPDGMATWDAVKAAGGELPLIVKLTGNTFHDFAGSTFVHTVGGWAALSGILLLGPRIGKYVNGVTRPIMGHSMPLATIGVFLLWLGWFGFNGGSVLSADPGLVSYVFVTTTLAAAAGIFGSMIVSWKVQKKPDLSMILNGCLAGLVGITAGADCVSITSAIVIGFIAGIIVVFAVIIFDKLKLDDPVGALSVHLVCGIWGTLAVGLFSIKYSFMTQLIGILVPGIFCFATSFLIFWGLKKTIGIRVTEKEELRGLDIEEHGMEAYSGFQIFTNQ